MKGRNDEDFLAKINVPVETRSLRTETFPIIVEAIIKHVGVRFQRGLTHEFVNAISFLET